MKKWLAIMTMLIIGFCTIFLSTYTVPNASAVGINILQSNYHIWGFIDGSLTTYDVNGDRLQPIPYYQTYDATSSNPLSTTIQFPSAQSVQSWYPSLGSAALDTSTTGVGIVSSYSSSYTMPTPKFQLGNDLVSFTASYAQAFAAATWTFRPLGDNLDLVINGAFSSERRWSGADIVIMDLTTNTVLYESHPGILRGGIGGDSWPYPYIGSPFVIDPNLVFTLGDTYSLTLRTVSESASDTNGLSLSANFTVPEPATMLLLGLGLIGLAGVRKKFEN